MLFQVAVVQNDFWSYQLRSVRVVVLGCFGLFKMVLVSVSFVLVWVWHVFGWFCIVSCRKLRSFGCATLFDIVSFLVYVV